MIFARLLSPACAAGKGTKLGLGRKTACCTIGNAFSGGIHLRNFHQMILDCAVGVFRVLLVREEKSTVVKEW